MSKTANNTQRVIVVGASSGIGQWLAQAYAAQGCRVGVAARREESLRRFCLNNPCAVWRTIDVYADNAPQQLLQLIEEVGGVDLLIYAAGCGWNNPQLNPERERITALTNCVGFTAIMDTAFAYMRDNGVRGHIAAITSVAGTKGIGLAPSYSASKRYGWEYLLALSQLSNQQKLGIRITDIRPGFIDTPLLDAEHHYPGMMTLDHAARLIKRGIDRGRSVVTVDARWRLLVQLWRRIPNFLWRRLPLSVPTR